MVKILGLPFDSFVDEQITIRQKRLALLQKTPQDLSVFNSNTAWVRLSSGVKIEPSRSIELSGKLGISQDLVQGTTLARKLVLWGGISSFSTGSNSISLDPIKGGIGYGLNNTYGFLSNPEQGLKPPPGITGITCDYKNNGSLKQATVTMKCYTRSQFEALEAVYLRLGYTVVLEWGNTLWYNNKEKFKQTTAYSVPNMLFKSENDLNPIDVAQQISNNKKNTSGNYDGMVGRVANYSWTLGDDLSFDIKLYLISAGDIIESLKMNVGGTNSADLSEKVTSKDGIFENVLGILVNKEASKLNTFFYELYQTVFKDAIKTDGSEENKEKIEEIDKVAIAAGYIQEVKDKYKKVTDAMREYYTSFEAGLVIYNKNIALNTKAGRTESILTTIAPEDIQGWENVASKFGVDTRTLALSYFTTKEEETAMKNFSKALNGVDSYFTNLKSSVETTGDIEFFKNSKHPQEDVVYMLNRGTLPPLTSGIKTPDTFFGQGTLFEDTEFGDLLEGLIEGLNAG